MEIKKMKIFYTDSFNANLYINCNNPEKNIFKTKVLKKRIYYNKYTNLFYIRYNNIVWIVENFFSYTFEIVSYRAMYNKGIFQKEM